MRAMIQQMDQKLSKLTKRLVESGLAGLLECPIVE